MFTIALIPDTQQICQTRPAAYEAMMQWLVDNKMVLNLRAVLGEGDNVNGRTTAEGQEMVVAWDIIKNAGLLYMPIPGNHDISCSGRDATWYLTYFGSSYFASSSFYAGCYNLSTSNLYFLLDVEDKKYLIIGLEYFPRNEVIAWAQSIISANTDREVIIVTHAYLTVNGTRFLNSDPNGATECPLADNNGQEMWDNLIKLNQNIFLVAGGHDINGATSAWLRSIGLGRNVVHQIFCNHQDNVIEGYYRGYIMLLQFDTSRKTITVTTYCPELDEYDSSGAYTLDYDPFPVGSTIVATFS